MGLWGGPEVGQRQGWQWLEKWGCVEERRMRRASTDHRGRGAALAGEGEDESCGENGMAGKGPDPE